MTRRDDLGFISGEEDERWPVRSGFTYVGDINDKQVLAKEGLEVVWHGDRPTLRPRKKWWQIWR